MIVSKIFTFESAHKLPNYNGPCSKLHGHTWKLVIASEGEVSKKTGMIIDFNQLDKIVNEKIISRLDHGYLNDVIENPTCENVIVWIQKELTDLNGLSKITLYENEKSFCELEI